MKIRWFCGSRYVALGVVGVSILLGACSSSGGGDRQTPEAATPLARSSPTPGPTTVPSTPTPASTRAAAPSPVSTPVGGVVNTPTPGVAAGEIRVTIKNNTFPKEIRVKAGSKVVFVVTNEQPDEKHSFELSDFDIKTDVEPLDTVRIEWVVPNAKGSWDMGCFLTEPPDVHDRMEGVLIIE